VQLQWSTTSDGNWWLFDHVMPAQLDGYGVFVIWRNGNGVKVSSVLYVGRGWLRDEFAKCRRDPIFHPDGLYVTWASVALPTLDGIAAYVYRELRPIWGEVAPLVRPLPVNLPLTA
jgi:hypothetical protein